MERLNLHVGEGLAELFRVLFVAELDEMAFEPCKVCLAVLMCLNADEHLRCGLLCPFDYLMLFFLPMEFSLDHIRSNFTFRESLELL